MNSGTAKNSPTANASTITPCIGGSLSDGTANGTSRMPTTGMIQAGVACATCCRSLIQRLTIIQANSTIPAAPIAHITRASSMLIGASRIGSNSKLIRKVPNRFPAIGWANSARTASIAVAIFTPYPSTSATNTPIAPQPITSATTPGAPYPAEARRHATLSPVSPITDPNSPIGR